ncbi:FliG C-terminal domain-containing protein [uncultured Litoreibacter sp.]|uniref:FliG C-terminal domain-containing protein n=1 Tax=uncultured Litoreibacter sp. TaxID=1392394 RepID=UPI002633765F|nr:FliG C-terminal domain-containing protein [uncultured Litoreibacter sp.]
MTTTVIPAGGTSMPAKPADMGPVLPGPQKAAIIIQMILSEGGSLPLSSLSARGQARLMQDFVELGRVDRATLSLVVADLERDLSMSGLSFPRSVADALSTLESHLNPEVVDNLRGQLGLSTPPAPWPKVAALPAEQLIALLPDEDPKIAAIVLSKLDPDKASEVLEDMDPDQATQVTLAMQSTATLSPDMVARIGTMLAAAIPSEKPTAFKDAPALRVANLLNAATPDKRDAVLASLTDQDAAFAEAVRASIFTFADIATRIAGPDIAKITRDVPQEELVMALAYAQVAEPASTDFLLANLSQRMAAALREEMEEQGEVPKMAGEAAMGRITSAIRRLADTGEVTILAPPGAEEDEAA